MFMHFFDIFIPLNLEDFDANVFPSMCDFFNDSSHGCCYFLFYLLE
jgi:hypothetical protein